MNWFVGIIIVMEFSVMVYFFIVFLFCVYVEIFLEMLVENSGWLMDSVE